MTISSFLRSALIGASFLALTGQGCLSVPPPQESMMPSGENKPVEKTEAVEPAATRPESASTYAPYTKTAYEKARAEGRPIFLYFYANWCPLCREQEPRIVEVFKTDTNGVAGFRVNYNDTDTDADEKQLAKEFVVTYQHTLFFIGRDGEVTKKIIGTMSNTDLAANLKLIAK